MNRHLNGSEDLPREIRATAMAEISLRNRIKTCSVEFEGKSVEEKEFKREKTRSWRVLQTL